MADTTSTCNGKPELEDEEGNIVTMVDVLKAEEILEENAVAVLGPGDDKNCTYNEGYLKRQALYSCLTCMPADGPDRGGICLACSYHCHGDHDLVELYTKRSFRCDCGNGLFKSLKCSLTVKTGTNEKNSYNKNFQGKYCSCSRPYPDPDETVEDEMIQCVVCEDWFHSRHLDSDVPNEDEYSEMICGPCTDKLPFLRYYLGHSVTKVSKMDTKEEDNSVNISVTEESTADYTTKQIIKNDLQSKEITSESADDSSPAAEDKEMKTEATEVKEAANANGEPKENMDTSVPESSKENIPENKIVEEVKNESEVVNKTLKGDNIETSKTELPAKVADCEDKKDKDCLLNNLEMLPRGTGATFWPEGFRKLLCSCSSCQDVYKGNNVSFLMEEEDTVHFYEEDGKARRQEVKAGPTQYERGMEALSSLDRVQQMEAILSYNEMKTHLSEYLAKFVENKKVVREEDIREFFSGMTARKRQKLDIPYNCR